MGGVSLGSFDAFLCLSMVNRSWWKDRSDERSGCSPEGSGGTAIVGLESFFFFPQVLSPVSVVVNELSIAALKLSLACVVAVCREVGSSSVDST